LRTVLWVDGLTGLASGAMQLAAPQWLGELYGLPATLIQLSAVTVLVFVALIAALLAKPEPSAWGLRTLVVGNVLWVVASVAVAVQVTTLTPMGIAYVLLQAGFVALLAYLQGRAAWRSGT
jgi:hypothetical protein